MMKAAFVVSLVSCALCLSVAGQESQNFEGKQSLGITASYSPTSSHILIGRAQQRRTFTAGVEYTRRLWEGAGVRLDYSGEFSPFFRESDPTIVGTESTFTGYTPMTPERTISVGHNAIGNECSATCDSIYPVYGRDETTYGAAIAPLGARAVFLAHRRLQPTFASNFGVILSTRDIPVDNTTLLNYQFSFGPGVQVFAARHAAVRLEYVYRHISNANLGTINPGIDQGVFRLTLSRYR
jgi:hypothetical protein